MNEKEPWTLNRVDLETEIVEIVPYLFTFQSPFTQQETYGISPKEPLV